MLLHHYHHSLLESSSFHAIFVGLLSAEEPQPPWFHSQNAWKARLVRIFDSLKPNQDVFVQLACASAFFRALFCGTAAF